MIRLEHINLVVKDLAPTQHFIQAAFPQWKVRGQGEMMWGSTRRQWMHIGDDDTYITLNDQGQGEIRELSGLTPGVAHIGFVVDDLKALIERLSEAGYAVDIQGADHPFRRNVYYTDPAGFQFEFIQYLSEVSSEKNLYGGETSSVKRQSRV